MNGTLVITFDDGGVSQYTGYEDLVTQGEKATFYIISNIIGTGSNLSVAQLQTMNAAGMDIQCHTYDHANLEHLTEVQVGAEYTNLDADFATWSLPAPRHTAYPFGANFGNVQAWTEPYRDTGRGTTQGYVIPSSSKMNLKIYGIGLDTDYDAIKAAMLVAYQNKYCIILLSHGIGVDQTPRDKYNEVIDYAQSIGMDIITMSELYALM